MDHSDTSPKGADDAIRAGAHLRLVGGTDLDAEARKIEASLGLETKKPAKPKEEKESQLEVLLRISADIEFARNTSGELYFTCSVVSADKGRHVESRALPKLKDELRRRFREETGSVASSEALSSVSEQLRAENEERHDLPTVTLRTQTDGETVYLDLCDGLGSVVEITGGEWSVTRTSKARFLRHSGMAALPHPEMGGNLNEIFRYITLDHDSERRLMLAWLLSAMMPTGPYPLAVLEGDHGAGKTTFARVLSDFVDPIVGDVREFPEMKEDLAIQARHSHLLAYDNMGGIKREFSNMLCVMSTGGTFSTRTRYSNTEETRLELLRPIVLTGISGLVSKPDLMERIIKFQIGRISDGDRRTEEDFRADFSSVKGRIYGALLTLLAKALEAKPSVKLAKLSRMADFNLLGEAIGRVLHWGDGVFSADYAAMRAELVADTMEGNPVASTLRLLMRDRSRWRGSWSELLDELDRLAPERIKRRPGWPFDGAGMSRAFRQAKTFLRESGLEYEVKPEGKQRTRVVTVSHVTTEPQTDDAALLEADDFINAPS